MEIWHKVTLDELFAKLDSSPNGLHYDEVNRRLKQYGQNIIIKKKKIPAIIRFFRHTTNFFALLLIMGALLAAIAEVLQPGQGNIYIAIALVIVVFLNALFSFYQETKVEQAMESFKKLMPEKAKVIRDGKEHSILASELVPGDIIILQVGDKVPADARLIEVNTLKADNSSLTGESEPQLRSLEMTHNNLLESRNVVFSGTIILSGDGKAVVYATGMETQLGKVAGLTQNIETTPTPIHRQLQHFIKIISTIAITMGIFFFILGFFFERGFLQNLIFSIGIIVAFVPEGLLPTVTLALSLSSLKMAKKNALIKNLESVETLGSTTVICTDKTGTITMDKMSVKSIFLGEGLIDITKIADTDKDDKKSADIHKLLHACVLCNNSNISVDNGNREYIGDPTEGALLMFAYEHISIDKLRASVPRLHEEPFDSKTKRMVSVNQYPSGKYAYMKGAPEVVLKKCKNVLINGRPVNLGSAYKKLVDNQCEEFSKKGERVLAFAYKKLNESKEYDVHDNYILIGVLSMIDPPRHDVPEAVAKCQRAGIRVIMITGDHPITSESIAREVGIIKTSNPRIITGDELNSMKHDSLLHALKEGEVLFARISPHQKLRIVKALQEHGEIVAVTGDGINDAPALKHADIGIAMGKSGQDVAKEAADMVLVDDNFATIVNAVEEGRTIYENIKNFITYILTHSTPEIMPFIVFALFGIPFALTVMLILLIDLGTDMVPALGLATEKSESDVMEQKPRKRDEKLLTKGMIIRSYLIFGMIEAAAGFFSYFYVLYSGGWTFGTDLAATDPLYMRAVTAFFVSIIITQIANVMICRVRRQSVFQNGLFSNRFVLVGIGVELLLTLFIVYAPIAHTFLSTASLSAFEFFLAVPFALLIFFGDELRRYYVRNNDWAREHLSF